MFSWSKTKEGHFRCAGRGGRADVGRKEQLKLATRQTHVGRDTQPRTVLMKGMVLWNPISKNQCLFTVQKGTLNSPRDQGAPHPRVPGPESLQLKFWQTVTSPLACWLQRTLQSGLASCVNFLLAGFGFHISFLFQI